eukprot:868527_1
MSLQQHVKEKSNKTHCSHIQVRKKTLTSLKAFSSSSLQPLNNTSRIGVLCPEVVATLRTLLPVALAPLPNPGQPPAILVPALREKSTAARIMVVLYYCFVCLDLKSASFL